MRSRLRLACAIAFATGCGNGAQLAVDLITDFAPGLEFAAVRTERVGERGSVLEERTIDAEFSEDYVEGVRVADFLDLEKGPQVVRVTLIDADGDELIHRAVHVELEGTRAVSVLIPRSCRDVICPGDGDDPSATECEGGRCAPPTCTPEDPESCPAPQCTGDDQCISAVSCAAGRCESGSCFFDDSGACGVGFWCDPDRGCVAIVERVDAGMPDGSICSDTCATLGYECGEPVICGAATPCGTCTTPGATCGGGGAEFRCGDRDVTPPTITIPPIADPAPSGYNDTPDVSFSFECTDALSGCGATSAICYVDGIQIACDWGSGSVGVGYSGPFAFGEHTLTITATDLAGNLGSGSITFNVARCANDMQYPDTTSNGLTRGGCCDGLMPTTGSGWYDPFVGYWHPRGDGSCRPLSDHNANQFERAWGSAPCNVGMQTTQWLQARGLPGCTSPTGRGVCVVSETQAQRYCGTDAMTGTQTPLHGRASEGWHPSPAAGCVEGAISSSLLMQRYGADDVCFYSLDRASERGSIGPSESCADGLTRYCRSNPYDPRVACVCTTSDPYADDGRG